MLYDFDRDYRRIPGEALGSVKWLAARAQGMPEGAVPFTIADMEFRAAPEIIEAVCAVAQNGYWGYTQATAAYNAAVTAWMKRRHGWDCSEDWIVCSSGIVQAIYTAVRAFTRPGDGVIIQPPVYPPFFSSVQDSGRRLVENPLVLRDGVYRMDFADLEAKARDAKMMILCSPHNPVGRVWSAEELGRVAEICKKHNVLVFADEIHGDLIMPGQHFTAYGTLGPGYLQNCLIGTSASKSFSLAGLSCSAIFVPDAGLREAFQRQFSIEGNGFNSVFGVEATRAAYTLGDAWLDEAVAYIQGNYDWVRDYLADNLPALRLCPMEGSYLCWIYCGGLGLAHRDMAALLQNEAKFFVNEGKMFGAGGEGFVRVNIACPRAALQGALEQLYKILSAYNNA